MNLSVNSNWPLVNFKDYVFFQEGPGIRSHEYRAQGCKIINVRCVKDGRLDLSNAKSVSWEKIKRDWQHFLIEENDILLTSSGTVGRLSKVTKSSLPLLMNTSVIRLRPLDKTELNEDYLRFFLMSNFFLNQLERQATQMCVKNVGPTHVRKTKLILPPIREQKDVVEILEEVDRLRKRRQEADGLTDKLIKSIFLEMFGDPIKNSKRWKMKKLGEALDVRDGTHDTPKYIDEGIPLITSKNLKNGKIDFDNVGYISRKDHEEISKRSFVEKGDILYGMIGTIGSPVTVDTNKEFSIKNVALFKFSGKKISNYFIKTLFQDDLLTRKLLMQQRGGTQKFVSLNILRNFEIPLPPLELQKKFTKFIQEVERVREKQEQSKEETENLFQSLMAKFFK